MMEEVGFPRELEQQGTPRVSNLPIPPNGVFSLRGNKSNGQIISEIENPEVQDEVRLPSPSRFWSDSDESEREQIEETLQTPNPSLQNLPSSFQRSVPLGSVSQPSSHLLPRRESLQSATLSTCTDPYTQSPSIHINDIDHSAATVSGLATRLSTGEQLCCMQDQMPPQLSGGYSDSATDEESNIKEKNHARKAQVSNSFQASRPPNAPRRRPAVSSMNHSARPRTDQEWPKPEPTIAAVSSTGSRDATPASMRATTQASREGALPAFPPSHRRPALHSKRPLTPSAPSHTKKSKKLRRSGPFEESSESDSDEILEATTSLSKELASAKPPVHKAATAKEAPKRQLNLTRLRQCIQNNGLQRNGLQKQGGSEIRKESNIENKGIKKDSRVPTQNLSSAKPHLSKEEEQRTHQNGSVSRVNAAQEERSRPMIQGEDLKTHRLSLEKADRPPQRTSIPGQAKVEKRDLKPSNAAHVTWQKAGTPQTVSRKPQATARAGINGKRKAEEALVKPNGLPTPTKKPAEARTQVPATAQDPKKRSQEHMTDPVSGNRSKIEQKVPYSTSAANRNTPFVNPGKASTAHRSGSNSTPIAKSGGNSFADNSKSIKVKAPSARTESAATPDKTPRDRAEGLELRSRNADTYVKKSVGTSSESAGSGPSAHWTKSINGKRVSLTAPSSAFNALLAEATTTKDVTRPSSNIGTAKPPVIPVTAKPKQIPSIVDSNVPVLAQAKAKEGRSVGELPATSSPTVQKVSTKGTAKDPPDIPNEAIMGQTFPLDTGKVFNPTATGVLGRHNDPALRVPQDAVSKMSEIANNSMITPPMSNVNSEASSRVVSELTPAAIDELKSISESKVSNKGNLDSVLSGSNKELSTASKVVVPSAKVLTRNTGLPDAIQKMADRPCELPAVTLKDVSFTLPSGDRTDPYFEYAIFQKKWSDPAKEDDADAIEVTARTFTCIEAANRKAEALFAHANNQHSVGLPIQLRSTNSKRDDYDCMTYTSIWGSIDYRTTISYLRIWVERHYVSAHAAAICGPPQNASFVDKTVYILRLNKLIEDPTAPRARSESPTSRSERHSDSSSDSSSSSEESDSDPDKGKHNKKAKAKAEARQSSGSPKPSAPRLPAPRNLIRQRLELPCREVYTTLSGANSAARRLQIDMSHETNPKPANAKWQQQNARELLEREHSLDPAMGGKKGFWKSEFNGKASGGDRFEVTVEETELCGPRNL